MSHKVRKCHELSIAGFAPRRCARAPVCNHAADMTQTLPVLRRTPDLFLVAAIVTTAYFACRVDARVRLPAIATATLLVVDAWFDVMTAGGRKATATAL